MSWLFKISRKVSVLTVLDHIEKALASLSGRSATVAKTFREMPNQVKIQSRGFLTSYFYDIYEKGSIFRVDTYMYIKRSDVPIPGEVEYDVSKSREWMRRMTVEVDDMDIINGHSLVYFHCFLSGYSPSRNWLNKYVVCEHDDRLAQLFSTRVESYSRHNTSAFDSVSHPLSTPYDIVKWVESNIDKAYSDFSDDSDDDEGFGFEPEPESPFSPSDVMSPTLIGV